MGFMLISVGVIAFLVLCLVLVARAYPGSGADLVDWKPTRSPELEAQLELDDVQLEWTYQPNSFDYIHVRCILGAIQDWAHLYREIYK